MKKLFRVASILLVVALAISVVGPALASDSSLRLYPGGNDPDGLPAGQTTYNIFYDQSFTFSYSGGPVCLSSQDGRCTSPAIDDEAIITVNGVVLDYPSFTNDFGPVDFTSYLHIGNNQLRVQIVDRIGPSRGGSELWLVPTSGGGSDGKLEITAVHAPIGLFTSARMGDTYKVEVEVYNPSSTQLTGAVYLEETGDVRGGDSLSGTKEQTITLGPGETKRIQFENYVHRWNWLDSVSSDCMNGGEIVKSAVTSYFGSLSKALESIDNAITWVQFAKDARLSDSRHKFTYYSYVVTNGQSSNKVSGEAWVDVPFWSKQLDFMTYWLSLWKGPSYIATGFVAQYYGYPGGQQFLDQGMLILASSCYSFESATDPDPNYKEIATPQPIVLSSTENKSGEYDPAFLDGLTYLSIQRALYQTTARYEGARAAGDAEWMEIQGRIARRYIVELLYALDAWDLSSTAMISATRGDNWQLSPNEVAIARTYLDEQGLPAVDVNLLRELGLEETQIEFIPVLAGDFLVLDTNWPRLSLPGEGLSSTYAETVISLNDELEELNGAPIDALAPTSSVQINGTIGLNDWFVSDVVITSNASDNPGGSGVARIEWSLDNGRTWNLYTEPFEHTQEGIFHLLVRAIDSEGNIQYPATAADFKVDKTPPVVIVWVDQPEYTRVQPYIAHFSGYDPEPGSGLASLLALFNNQPVIDGQVVDLFWLPLGTYTLTATGEDNAGWVTTNSKTITLTATIPSLQQAVNRLCAENYITKQGICTSLSQKLASALFAQQRGQNKTAVNILLAFQNELSAQKGKAVTLKAYDLLMMDSNYVIQVLGGK